MPNRSRLDHSEAASLQLIAPFFLSLALVAAVHGVARAQTIPTLSTDIPTSALPLQGAPSNVVNLSSSGFQEAQQDWLSMSLTTTNEGGDAAGVQRQLMMALDAALAVAMPAAQPLQMVVRTGQFSLHPRYGNNGKINGWIGTTELVIEGRDFARISSTAGKIQSLTVGQVNFSLSREAQQKLEADVQAMAIDRFKNRAQDIAKGFGFSGYSLREIAISSADQESGGPPFPRVMAMQAKSAMSDAPVPVEAGRTMVTVTVSGSIQMR